MSIWHCYLLMEAKKIHLCNKSICFFSCGLTLYIQLASFIYVKIYWLEIKSFIFYCLMFLESVSFQVTPNCIINIHLLIFPLHYYVIERIKSCFITRIPVFHSNLSEIVFMFSRPHMKSPHCMLEFVNKCLDVIQMWMVMILHLNANANV